MHCSTIYYLTVSVILMLIFLIGYFPITQNELIEIDPPKSLNNHQFDTATLYKPQVDRLILVIIDALRYDFITQEKMPYLYENMNCLIKCKVEAPTVTLPRLKALTTGGIPQYIDIVLNLGAKAKVDDSFIHQAHLSGRKIVFYGDDTWVMMFPKEFERHDGTTSFFVNDFTEVDDNVTRYLDYELQQNDWDMMILHYLGLDHIGHVRGPFSSLINPKLHEMDDVVKKLIKTSNSWKERTLIIITGDHGMKDSGGHGGTTYAETHVPVVIYHNKYLNCSAQEQNPISQTDITNTLSALFGIRMPANSVGKVLLPLLNKDNLTELLYIMEYNSIILERKSKVCTDKLQMARNYFSNDNEKHLKLAVDLYNECLKEMSDDLITTFVKQDSVLMIFGIVGTINCFFSLFYFSISPENKKGRSFNSTDFIQLVILFAFIFHSFIFPSFIIQIALTCLSALLTLRNAGILFNLKHWLPYYPFILHALLLSSSSYMEDEHYIYYYFICTASIVVALLYYRETKRVTMTTAMPLTIIEIIRVLRALNPDWLLDDEHTHYLQFLHIIALVVAYLTFQIVILQNMSMACYLYIQPLIFFLIFLHKFYFYKEVVFAQIIWLLIGVQLLPFYPYRLRQFDQRLMNVWISVAMFQLRPYNTLLVPAIILCSLIFKQFIRNINHISIIHVWLGYTFFFLQGHRNSIANIDLAPGYIGLSSYVPVIVGFLTLCHTYCFPILSLLLLFYNNGYKFKQEALNKAFNTIVTYKIFILAVNYVMIFIQQGHLFVWSVFAPKLSIECAHTFVLFLQILFYYLYKGIGKQLKY